MYVATTPVWKSKLDIHVVDSGFGAVHSDIRLAGSAGRACGRARVRRGSSPPTPQPDEDAFFQEGRSVERDVLKTHPNPRYPQVRATLRRNWARATIRRLARNAGPGGSGFRLAGQWAILYSYRWQCDQCLLAVVGPGLRFTVMSFLRFGVKETGGMLLVLFVNIYRSIERTNERTMGDGRD